MRDFLKGLDLDKETVDSIMAEYGKNLQGLKETNEDLTKKVNTYETEIKTLKESSQNDENWKETFEALDTKIKNQEAENKKKQEDEILTNNIITVFGDKKFTSDYVKNGLISDIKSELNKPENKGKGISEIFESLTKDKTGIFENPNKPANMPGMGENDTTSDNITKEMFNKMSYLQRVELKEKNPELFKKMNN